MLCKDCKYLKSKMVGHIGSVYWCGKVGNGWKNTSIGVFPWMEKPHPKCPMSGDNK